jgi:NAD(P)-dependent dehydrogenase (short-subunit alcohol dehydrogenase family)
MSSMFSLEGKVAIVTGASRWTGKVIALEMAKAGVDLIISARTSQSLTTLHPTVTCYGVLQAVSRPFLPSRASPLSMEALWRGSPLDRGSFRMKRGSQPATTP